MIKKSLFQLLILSLVIFIVSCNGVEETHPHEAGEVDDHHDEEVAPEPADELAPQETETPEPTPKKTEPAMEKESAVKEISMIARSWEFEPSEIRVKKGDKVRLSVTSEDITHGIFIKGHDVSTHLQPGSTEVLEFVADKAGEFEYFCNVPCGSGHTHMKGKMIVE